MKIHPAAEVFPLMDDESFQALKEDIREHGVQENIMEWDGFLLDGRNRLRAMEELDIDPSYHTCELDTDLSDPWEYAISANLHRRHLTTSQRAMVAASLAGLKRGRPELNGQKCPFTLSNAQAAKKLTVSPMAVKQAKAVQEQCSKPIQEMVKQGELTVSAAQNLAKAVPDKKEQAKLAKQGTQAVKTATKKYKNAGARSHETQRWDWEPPLGHAWGNEASLGHKASRIG